MLKIIVPTIMLIPTTMMVPSKWLWPTTLIHGLLISILSFIWLKTPAATNWNTLNTITATAGLSIPLMVLTCWLLPLMILASQKHMTHEPLSRQRMFIVLMTSLQISLVLAFSATELLLFYVMFETTLIPTLILITRWANQAARLNAGTYIPVLYTRSAPFLYYSPFSYYKTPQAPSPYSHYSTHQLLLYQPPPTNYDGPAAFYHFYLKMPLYGMHLWLPKAHVEAPIAGSMVLAAVLLKLGGYGMMRMLTLLEPLTKELSYSFIVLALWGIIMTGTICLRQTDLKSLIAYSSVGHMGLVAGGILTQTSWGLTGALVLMIAHGLTSSALFCLANINYERTHSRTMLLARGLQMLLPLMATWWFMASLANLALPPLPNLTGELVIITSLFNWSGWTIVITGSGTLITAGYSLYMFLMTQRGHVPTHIISIDPSHTREHLLITLHLLPLLLLTMKPELIWGWIM
uniref:NADH-ubiquinone oxidoreductase chain 4 n=1 Tax=Odontobutis potamophilus TaxID=3358257 RepID=W6DHE6_9GOBI|nr:NADH dehydrogenase subunit 4 [Odontobutis potamophila]